MVKTKIAVASLMSLVLVLPALGKTYKYNYAIPCSQLWSAVKDTLGNQDNYAGVKADDAQLSADYAPKHSVHFDVSGVILQRMNHVRLVSQAEGCEMEVVSNFSGWGHEDQGDFKKRVDDALTKPKPEAPAPAKPIETEKPATPAR